MMNKKNNFLLHFYCNIMYIVYKMYYIVYNIIYTLYFPMICLTSTLVILHLVLS